MRVLQVICNVFGIRLYIIAVLCAEQRYQLLLIDCQRREDNQVSGPCEMTPNYTCRSRP